MGAELMGAERMGPLGTPPAVPGGRLLRWDIFADTMAKGGKSGKGDGGKGKGKGKGKNGGDGAQTAKTTVPPAVDWLCRNHRCKAWQVDPLAARCKDCGAARDADELAAATANH